MRIETTTRTIASFKELTKEQQNKALDNLDLSDDFEFQAESTIEYFTEALTMLGFSNVKINYSGFWSQGDGASFTGTFDVPKTVKELNERVKKVKTEFPTLNLCGFNSMRFTKEEKEEGLSVYRIDSRYSHNCTITSDSNDLKEFARSFSNVIYKSLERDYDYINSAEYKSDAIEANNWEFYLDTLKLA